MMVIEPFHAVRSMSLFSNLISDSLVSSDADCALRLKDVRLLGHRDGYAGVAAALRVSNGLSFRAREEVLVHAAQEHIVDAVLRRAADHRINAATRT